MLKNNTSQRLDNNLEDSLMDLPACQWIKEHLKEISYGVLIFLLLIVLLYRLLASQSTKAESDYFSLAKAATILNNSESNEEARESALLEMKTLLALYPSLHAKYDGLIAEQLLIEKNLQEAAPYIDRTFSRVKNEDSPFYIDYAKTSLLLTEGNKAEALKQAYLLRENMLKSPPFNGGVLYAFNLIRIALLEKQEQHKDLELKAWNELKQMGDKAHTIPISAQDLQRVMTHFDNEGAKLNSFIK
jgi:hypothetical protein